MPFAVEAWFLLPADCEQPPPRPASEYLSEPSEGLLVCLAEPGDVVFVPRNWWHATWNLDDSVGVGWEAEDERSEAVSAVLDGDFKATEVDTVEKCPLMEAAARSGQLKILQSFEISGKEAASVAIAAAHSDRLDILKYVYGTCGDVMFRHRMWWLPSFLRRGTTALHEAASCGHAGLVTWMLKQKAEIFADDRGCLPIHLAATNGHTEVLRLMPRGRHVPGETSCIHQAAFGGHAGAVRFLCQDLDDRDALSQSAMHYAASRGFSNVLLTLLEAKATVNAADQAGATPLHCAASASLTALVPFPAVPPAAPDSNILATRLLLEWRADVTATNCDGQTPSDLAELSGHHLVRDLIRAEKNLIESFCPCRWRWAQKR